MKFFFFSFLILFHKALAINEVFVGYICEPSKSSLIGEITRAELSETCTTRCTEDASCNVISVIFDIENKGAALEPATSFTCLKYSQCHAMEWQGHENALNSFTKHVKGELITLI